MHCLSFSPRALACPASQAIPSTEMATLLKALRSVRMRLSRTGSSLADFTQSLLWAASHEGIDPYTPTYVVMEDSTNRRPHVLGSTGNVPMFLSGANVLLGLGNLLEDMVGILPCEITERPGCLPEYADSLLTMTNWKLWGPRGLWGDGRLFTLETACLTHAVLQGGRDCRTSRAGIPPAPRPGTDAA